MFRTTNRLYLKNFLVFLLPFLLLSLAACGGSGSSGGSSDVGKTAAIEMDPEAETLAAGSGSSVYIDVQLTDSTGNPVDTDTSVIFRTNIGSFDNGKKEIRKKTADESGMIRIAFHAPLDAPEENEEAIIEAESNGVHQSVTITVWNPSEVLTIALTLGSGSIVADGNTQVTARAVVTNSNGAAVSGKRVNFSSTAGTLITASDITDASGTAEVRLQSSTISGPVTVRAECDGFTDEATMEFVPGPVDKILLNALPSVVPPDGQFQIAAIVMDENENRINTERLKFELRRRGSSEIIDQAELTPDQAEDGVYRSNLSASYGTGFFTITVVANNGVKETVVVQVEERAVIVGSVNVTSGSASLEADGSSEATIRATVLDNEGQPAPGITVNFSTTLGTLLPSSRTTDENGIAEVRLRAGYTEGTAKVEAEANGWRDDVEIDFEAGFPSRLNISVIPDVVEPGETATVIATLTDSSGDPISAEELYFSLSTNVSGGSILPGTVTTDGSGQATATYTAGSIEGTDRIRVVSSSNSSVNAIASVRVRQSGGVVVPDQGSLYLTPTKTAVKTDGRDKSTITATLLDDSNAPIVGAIIRFTAEGGQISASGVVTDENGRASVEFSSGPDKTNQTVLVEATAGDLGPASIPITLYGTEIIITPSSAQISTGGESRDIVIKAVDADDNPILNASVEIEQISGPGDLIFSPSLPDTFITDLNGEIDIRLTTGAEAGEAVIEAQGLGTSTTASYQIGEDQDIFQITDPTESPFFHPADGSPVDITVHAGGMDAGDTVIFYSSLGEWADAPGSSLTDEVLASANADVTKTLSSDQAGTATVEVYDADDYTRSDSIQIYFYNPADLAYDINIQASQASVLPSTGTTQYSVTITATVTAQNGAPVRDAQVYFTLSNTTGGGEYLSPVTVRTNSSGDAETTFTSGTVGTGSEIDDAVLVTGTVATPAHPVDDTRSDSVPIIIRGEAANVSIGYSTEISPNDDNTQYLLPVSVLVADTNGNPVPGQLVSLSLRPSRFKTGYWYFFDPVWEAVEDNPCDGLPNPLSDTSQATTPYIFINEDLNGNSVLDEDEDQTDRYTEGQPGFPPYFDGYSADPADQIPGLNDGRLTPGQSVAGNIPTNVETDENGVASFTLRYQKEYAVWVEAQLTASCVVFGTEHKTDSRKWLPVSAEEVSGEDAVLPNAFPRSPFNVLPCGEAN
jgi:hypothetical protein